MNFKLAPSTFILAIVFTSAHSVAKLSNNCELVFETQSHLNSKYPNIETKMFDLFEKSKRKFVVVKDGVHRGAPLKIVSLSNYENVHSESTHLHQVSGSDLKTYPFVSDERLFLSAVSKKFPFGSPIEAYQNGHIVRGHVEASNLNETAFIVSLNDENRKLVVISPQDIIDAKATSRTEQEPRSVHAKAKNLMTYDEYNSSQETTYNLIEDPKSFVTKVKYQLGLRPPPIAVKVFGPPISKQQLADNKLFFITTAKSDRIVEVIKIQDKLPPSGHRMINHQDVEQIIHLSSEADNYVVRRSDMDKNPHEVMLFVARDSYGRAIAQALVHGERKRVPSSKISRLLETFLSITEGQNYAAVEIIHSHPSYELTDKKTVTSAIGRHMTLPIHENDMKAANMLAEYIPSHVPIKFSAVVRNGYTYSVFIKGQDDITADVNDQFESYKKLFQIQR